MSNDIVIGRGISGSNMLSIGIPGVTLGGGGGGGCTPFDQIDGNVASGATFTHPADGVIGWTETVLPSGTFTQCYIRRADANNYWNVYIGSAGQFGLTEVVAGTGTNRANVAGVVSNGHRIVIACDGTTILGYSNGVLRFTYASASNFATATAGVFSQVGGAPAVVSDLKTWTLACRASEGV